MGLEYLSRIFEKAWSISASTLGLDLLFRALSGRKLGFGVWMELVTDRVLLESSNANEFGDFQYEPLGNGDDMRLFLLDAGEHGEPLRGQIVNVRMDEAPKYEALSYVWGSPRRSLKLRIGSQHMLITENLYDALIHLRRPEGPRALWIDQLCIDQANILERNHQVGIMDVVYGGADTVLIWLGRASRYSSSGLQLLQWFARERDRTSTKPVPWERDPPTALRAGLADIFSREWFSRIWVVQEVARSRKATMMCGEESFSWSDDLPQLRRIRRRMKLAALSPGWYSIDLHQVNMSSFIILLDVQEDQILTRQWSDYKQNAPDWLRPHLNGVGTNKRPAPDLLDIAYQFRHKQSSDPRDKVYALAGLAPVRFRERLLPNYGESYEQVFDRLQELLRVEDDDWWEELSKVEEEAAKHRSL